MATSIGCFTVISVHRRRRSELFQRLSFRPQHFYHTRGLQDQPDHQRKGLWLGATQHLNVTPSTLATDLVGFRLGRRSFVRCLPPECHFDWFDLRSGDRSTGPAHCCCSGYGDQRSYWCKPNGKNERDGILWFPVATGWDLHCCLQFSRIQENAYPGHRGASWSKRGGKCEAGGEEPDPGFWSAGGFSGLSPSRKRTPPSGRESFALGRGPELRKSAFPLHLSLLSASTRRTR